jgi:hypothetical protein
MTRLSAFCFVISATLCYQEEDKKPPVGCNIHAIHMMLAKLSTGKLLGGHPLASHKSQREKL